MTARRAGAALLAAFCACRGDALDETPTASAASPPNVLLVTIDTLRADHVGSYGFPLGTTPAIDALAARGVVFDRAIAASSATVPSHASIMTSRYVREHAVGYSNGGTQLGDERLLAELFAESGYATAAFVGNSMLKARVGLNRGFDTYDDELERSEPNRPRFFERVAGDTNARVRAWLASQGARPFFLWLHYQDPHGPYAPPPAHRGRFRLPPEPDERPLEVVPSITGWQSIPAYQAIDGLYLPSEYRARYADEVAYVDSEVRALLRAVEAHSAGRSLVVLLTSDHGESFGEDGHYFVHGYGTTPQLAHVPLLLSAPGLRPGRRPGVASHVDIMPTLLELAGLDVPEGGSGIALGPHLREGRALPDRVVYCDVGSEVAAYGREGFTRVLGLRNAWEPDPIPKPAWMGFDWDGTGRWSLADPSTPAHPTVEAYFLTAVPMREARAPDSDELEQLRALGYAE